MTISEIQKEIIDEFKPYKEWQDLYSYLIKLGQEAPSIKQEYKTDDYLIKGCQVKTWYHCIYENGRLIYEMDSNSLMIRGILAILRRIFSGQKPDDIAAANFDFIQDLGLMEHFSPVRANSLYKIAYKIKADAANYQSK